MKELKLIENFLKDENIIKIENDLRTFNPIKILTKGTKEELHSKVLAWLLDPNENHNFGDAFLKLFFEEIFSTKYYDLKKNESPELSVTDIRFSHFYNSAISTEITTDSNDKTGRIDILIINNDKHKDKGIVCVIENKTRTHNHHNQLDKYYEDIEGKYSEKEYIKKYIYLTPEGDCPLVQGDHEEKYICVGYQQILEMINKILTYKQTSLSPYLMGFIENYKRVIETDLLGQNTSLDEIREVCDKHKEIINLIKNKKGGNKEIIELMNNQNELLKKIIDEFIPAETKLLVDIAENLDTNKDKNNIEISPYSSKTVIRFLPKDLLLQELSSSLQTSDNNNAWSTKKTKNEKKYGIFLEITNRGNEVTFQIVSGYKSNSINNKLINNFPKHRQVKDWIVLYSDPLFKSKEYDELLNDEDNDRKQQIETCLNEKVFNSIGYKESIKKIQQILKEHVFESCKY